MYRFNKTTVFDDIFTYSEVNNQAGTLGVAREYFYWIQMHGDELLHSIQKLVSDINSWKQMYYSICHINLELKLMEPHNTVSQELQDNSNGQELSLDAIAHYLLILSLKKSLKTTIWVFVKLCWNK